MMMLPAGGGGAGDRGVEETEKGETDRERQVESNTCLVSGMRHRSYRRDMHAYIREYAAWMCTYCDTRTRTDRRTHTRNTPVHMHVCMRL